MANSLWGNQIRSNLFKGYSVITMKPIGGTVTPATFASGEGIRVSITLGWTELRRNRTVKMENVRW